MIQIDREGYSACDIRPDGGFVAVREPRDSHLLTHLGTLVCPEVPHWPRCTPVGAFRVAVQGAARTREWTGGLDWLVHREACGAPSPVLYDRDGRLHVSDCAGGAEGLHHVAPDGRLVWGAEVTMRAGSELRESTDLGGGLIAGQGPHGGCWLQAPDGYREIGSGLAMCVRATRDGDRLAICWYEPDVPHRGSATAHFRWFTVAELLAMPVKATTLPPWQDEPPHPVPAFAPAAHDVVVRAFHTAAYVDDVFPAVSGRRRPLVFVDTRADQAKRLERARLAAQLDADLGVYTDIATFDVEALDAVRALCREHNVSVPVIPVQQMYPWREPPKLVGRLRSTAEQVALVRASLQALRTREPRIAAAVACYRQIDAVEPHPAYNWPLRASLEMLPEAWALVCEFRISDVLPFTWTRAGGLDGIVSREEFRGAYARLTEAAAAGPIEAAPAIPPREAPRPEPPPVPQPAPEPTPCAHIDVKHIDGMWICLLCGESIPKPAWWIDEEPADVIRPDTPISGNAIADFFRWLSRINFRKWLR